MIPTEISVHVVRNLDKNQKNQGLLIKAGDRLKELFSGLPFSVSFLISRITRPNGKEVAHRGLDGNGLRLLLSIADGKGRIGLLLNAQTIPASHIYELKSYVEGLGKGAPQEKSGSEKTPGKGFEKSVTSQEAPTTNPLPAEEGPKQEIVSHPIQPLPKNKEEKTRELFALGESIQQTYRGQILDKKVLTKVIVDLTGIDPSRVAPLFKSLLAKGFVCQEEKGYYKIADLVPVVPTPKKKAVRRKKRRVTVPRVPKIKMPKQKKGDEGGEAMLLDQMRRFMKLRTLATELNGLLTTGRPNSILGYLVSGQMASQEVLVKLETFREEIKQLLPSGKPERVTELLDLLEFSAHTSL